MKTSAAGRALIEAFEGLRLTAYRDAVGVLTIGYGHTNAAGLPRVVPGMTISKQTADNTLANDLRSVEENVERCVHGVMSQCEFDALVSFDFNTGSLGKSTIDDKINRGDKRAAMATLLKYTHAGGKVLNGLVRRRKAEKLMYEGQIDAALRLAGAHEIIGTAAPVGKAEPEPHKQPQSRKTGAAAIVVAATTVAATQSDSWPIIAAIVGVGIVAAVIVYLALNKKH